MLLSGGSLLVGVVTLAYTQVDAVAGLVGLRLITGLGEAAVFVGAATATQDMAPSHRRGEAASYFSVALYSGLALGPALGERLADSYGYDEVWLAAGLAAIVAAILGLGTPAHHAVPDEKPTALLYRAALGPGVVLMLGLIPFTGFAAFLAVYGPDIGLDETAPVFFAYAGTVLAIRIFGAKLPDRLGWRLASSIALTAVGAGALVLALWASVRGGVDRGGLPRRRHVVALPGPVLRRPRRRARPRAQPGGGHVLALLRPVTGHRRATARVVVAASGEPRGVPGRGTDRRDGVLGAAPPPPRAPPRLVR